MRAALKDVRYARALALAGRTVRGDLLRAEVHLELGLEALDLAEETDGDRG